MSKPIVDTESVRNLKRAREEEEEGELNVEEVIELKESLKQRNTENVFMDRMSIKIYPMDEEFLSDKKGLSYILLWSTAKIIVIKDISHNFMLNTSIFDYNMAQVKREKYKYKYFLKDLDGIKTKDFVYFNQAALLTLTMGHGCTYFKVLERNMEQGALTAIIAPSIEEVYRAGPPPFYEYYTRRYNFALSQDERDVAIFSDVFEKCKTVINLKRDFSVKIMMAERFINILNSFKKKKILNSYTIKEWSSLSIQSILNRTKISHVSIQISFINRYKFY
eukprot:GHVR01015301.1.p1 GENE.GHVR01015301.1~~GHVR01015301.1.p1  ORF type:complete len:278 (-),score=26.98 GHVR01015301.1:428-1261(-)